MDQKNPSLAELQAQLAALQAQNDELKARASRPAAPRKENYFFVANGTLGEKQIEIPFSVHKDGKFLPSKAGKRLVCTVGVQFPGGIRGQLVLTKDRG